MDNVKVGDTVEWTNGVGFVITGKVIGMCPPSKVCVAIISPGYSPSVQHFHPHGVRKIS